MTSRETSINAELAFLEYLGGFLWIIGFVVEAVSDSQKTRFREDVNNKYTFIRSGLWKYSRHPNYVGEFVIWIGAAIFAIPSLSGSQLISLGSPLFVYLLIAKVSGVPML
jgi:steroid 5-alpha reductase family enzyme